MKQQVDKLIANLLLDEGEVYLPRVGTLILYRHSARLLSAKQLQAPYRELRLTREERGVDMICHLAKVAEITTERAGDIYAEWLEQSLRNDILTIDGVACIEKGTITTDKTFEDMANPQGNKKIKVNPRTNYFIYIVAALCMGFALGIAGYVLHTNGTFDKILAKQEIAPASQAFENAPAQPTEEVVEQPTPTVATPVVEDKEEDSIQPLKSGYSYAVWGVYNELQNAQNAVTWLSERVPEVEGAKIYEYDGRYMVALCEVASRSACGRQVSAWKAEHKSFKNVWVYTRE